MNAVPSTLSSPVGDVVAQPRWPLRTTLGLALLGLLLVALALTGLLAAMGYRATSADDPGLTSEVTLVLTFLLGAMAMRTPALATGLAVVVAVQARSLLVRSGQLLAAAAVVVAAVGKFSPAATFTAGLALCWHRP